MMTCKKKKWISTYKKKMNFNIRFWLEVAWFEAFHIFWLSFPAEHSNSSAVSRRTRLFPLVVEFSPKNFSPLKFGINLKFFVISKQEQKKTAKIGKNWNYPQVFSLLQIWFKFDINSSISGYFSLLVWLQPPRIWWLFFLLSLRENL